MTNQAKQAYLREVRRFKEAAAADAERVEKAESSAAQERSAR